MKYAFFLGSHSKLSRLELETVLAREGRAYQLVTSSSQLVVADVDEKLPGDFLQRLGGIDRIARVVGAQDAMWEAGDVYDALPRQSGGQAHPTDKKFVMGISTIDMPAKYGGELARELKRTVKAAGGKMSFVLPKGRASMLNAAQVIFNRLSDSPNQELTFAQVGGEFYLLVTKQIQDIQAYEERDTARPARDAEVGLLPPKLAQIMLNLVPSLAGKPPTVLDPFCGMGTVLQEGWLMGYQMAGSDVSIRLLEMAAENLDWLASNRSLESAAPELLEHDVQQPFASSYHKRFDAVATEPYLGKPLRTPLSRDEAAVRADNLSKLYLSFFKNIHPLMKNDSWVVFILPTVRLKGSQSGWHYFPTAFIDEVEKIGYRLKHLGGDERGILYARPDALVGREITLWHIRKLEGQHN